MSVPLNDCLHVCSALITLWAPSRPASYSPTSNNPAPIRRDPSTTHSARSFVICYTSDHFPVLCVMHLWTPKVFIIRQIDKDKKNVPINEYCTDLFHLMFVVFYCLVSPSLLAPSVFLVALYFSSPVQAFTCLNFFFHDF